MINDAADPPLDVIGPVSIVVVFAVIAFLECLFGHPSRGLWQFQGVFLGWLMTMKFIDTCCKNVEYRLRDIQRKLDAIAKGK
jgi:hypothetical protein